MSSQTPWNSAYNNVKGSLLVGNNTRPIVHPVGTNGQFLTADSTQANGVAWTSTGAVLEGSITLTSLQVKALHVTPILVLPPPGANKWITIYWSVARMAFGGTNAFSGGGSGIALGYGTNIPSLAIAANPAATNGCLVALNSSSCISDLAIFNNKPDSNLYNVGIYAVNNGAAVTGNAANNNTVTIKFLYYVFTIP